MQGDNIGDSVEMLEREDVSWEEGSDVSTSSGEGLALGLSRKGGKGYIDETEESILGRALRGIV